MLSGLKMLWYAQRHCGPVEVEHDDGTVTLARKAMVKLAFQDMRWALFPYRIWVFTDGVDGEECEFLWRWRGRVLYRTTVPNTFFEGD
jgi:hypothetical protein